MVVAFILQIYLVVISIRTQKKIKREVDEAQKRLSSLESNGAHVSGGGGSVATTAQRTSSEETKEKNSNDEENDKDGGDISQWN